METVRFLLSGGVNYVLTRKFHSDPIEALFAKLRFICEGNDALDARAVTAALDHNVKEKALPSKKTNEQGEDVDEAVTSVPQDIVQELEVLREHLPTPPASVADSGLVYVGGYIAKLIGELGCDACVMLVTTNNTNRFLNNLLRTQETGDITIQSRSFYRC